MVQHLFREFGKGTEWILILRTEISVGRMSRKIMSQFKKENEKNIYLTLGIFCAGHYLLYLIKTKGGGGSRYGYFN